MALIPEQYSASQAGPGVVRFVDHARNGEVTFHSGVKLEGNETRESGVTLTVERACGQRFKVRLPKAGAYLARVIARGLEADTGSSLVIGDAGYLQMDPQCSNLGRLESGPDKGAEVIF